MTLVRLLPFAAGLFSLLLAVASLLRGRPSPATWLFFAGMAALGIDSLFTGLGLRAAAPDELLPWLTWSLVAKSFIPVLWLAFSLAWSRGEWRAFLVRWRVPLALLGLLPLVTVGFRDQLVGMVPVETGEGWLLRFGTMGQAVNAVLVVALVPILMNLEQTFRAAVGTMRWRIKFVVLGLAVIFATRLYVRSQAVLFSAPDMQLAVVESSALLVGCLFLALAYARTGLAEIDVYPSLAVLRSSLTLVLVGAYLFIVGILAEAVRRLGGAEGFHFRAFVLLLGIAGLAVLLLSDRLRQRVHAFAVRHFRRAQHDSVRTWTLFSQRLANVRDQASLCQASARLVSETFDVLSVTIWLLDEGRDQLVVGASTARHSAGAGGVDAADTASSAVAAGLRTTASPFDLEAANEAWAEELRQLNPTTFAAKGGHRWCVPLRAGDRTLGALVLADRVNGAPYTGEELELLTCIGHQIASVLQNLRLAEEVAEGKELEAFRTMSAFFVHDLKNAAASLNLTLKNLPVHFDDPAFREDALRGVGNTARRIDDLIARLSALRQRPEPEPTETDVSQLVREAVERVGDMPGVELVAELPPLPAVFVDREQLRSVVANLLLNARDAVGAAGRIEVRTEHRGGRVTLSVADTGCGMSPAFLKESLFRPFQSTKKHGLGIGLFQARMIVEAHGGSIQVESEPGKGTTARVSLPVTHTP